MKGILRIVGIILLLILILLIMGGVYVYAQSNSIITQTYDIDLIDFDVPEASDELLEEGRRIFVSRGCIDCHGQDGGGYVIAEDAVFGTLAGPNLTGGNGSQNYSSEDYMRAILHGVGTDGRGLVIMPSMDYNPMREEELSALLVYLTNIEAVDNEVPAMNYGPLLRALLVFNQIPLAADLIDHSESGLVELEAGASIEYGDYLANTTCVGCHGANFGGMTTPGSNMIARNLTPHEDGLAGWTLEDFQTAIQTGITPDGEQLDPAMPVVAFQALTETEVEAIFLYLQSLEPVAGN